MTLTDEVRLARRLPAPATARMIRIAAGVSQARLAQEVGVHRMSIVRWENGTRRPRGVARAAYVQVLADLQREVTAA